MSTSITASPVASEEEIRAHFPALRRQHAGRPVAYFDGPGGTQVPLQVVDAMRDYLLRHNANTHWAFPTSIETDEAIVAARAAVADFVNARPEEVAFGANMTSLTFHVARAIGRGLQRGDEIVVTELDHHANIDPWRALERERGAVIRIASVRAEEGVLDWTSLEQCIGPATRVVAIGAASNAIGTVSDVARAARMARSHGAYTFVDAVHYAPHILPDVHALECDFLACSAYKFFGPHVGVLFGRGELLAALDVPKLLPAGNAIPERLETGTQNHEGIVGTAAAIDFLASLAGPSDEDRRERLAVAYHALHGRGDALLRRLGEGLGMFGEVSLYGPPPGTARTPTLSFSVAGYTSLEVARHLANRGVFVAHGDFYATTLVARLGHADDGLVRAGCVAYTTQEEVDRLVEGVAALLGA